MDFDIFWKFLLLSFPKKLSLLVSANATNTIATLSTNIFTSHFLHYVSWISPHFVTASVMIWLLLVTGHNFSKFISEGFTTYFSDTHMEELRCFTEFSTKIQ